MMDKWVSEICEKALVTFGAGNQKRKLVQEVCELLEAITRYDEGRDTRRHVAEEIADVAIMLNQMILLFDCEEEVTREGQQKLERLLDRVREAQGDKNSPA